MAPPSKRRRGLLRTFVATLGLLNACSPAEKTVGQLVVSIETDMALPQQVDTIRVQVLVHGQPYLDADYPVGTANGNSIPATINLLAGSNPSQPVTVRVSGGNKAVVVGGARFAK